MHSTILIRTIKKIKPIRRSTGEKHFYHVAKTTLSQINSSLILLSHFAKKIYCQEDGGRRKAYTKIEISIWDLVRKKIGKALLKTTTQILGANLHLTRSRPCAFNSFSASNGFGLKRPSSSQMAFAIWMILVFGGSIL